MVTSGLRETVDALSAEDRVSLLEYLERTTDFGDAELTDEQLTMLDRRDAEMDANPELGVPEGEFIARLKNKWL
jgi:putative addiction module component (TIGR02574 family)